ncbi:MAG: MlaD family protein [Hylemonella sp.]|nr:MlaD family protein [Hylemonella sp.]
MENKAHAIAAGVFVLGVAALLIALAVWLTRDTGGLRRYEIATRGTITGLLPQASVRYRGVKVGKVAEVNLDPRTPGQVLVLMDVEPDTPVTRSTYATLGYQGLTGIAFVQLDDSGESREPLQAAAGELPRIPMRAGFMEQWSRQGERLLGELEETARRVNQLLAPENQQALRKSIDALGEAAAAVPPALQQAGQSFDAMRSAAASVSASADRVRAAADDYAGVARRLQQPGGTLEQMQQGAGALASSGQALQQTSLPRLNRTLDDAGRTVRQLGRTAATLDDNPQALIYGPALGLPGPGEPGFAIPRGTR